MSRNGSKTGGLRYLWIPGRKRSHPKGRLDTTSKRFTQNSGHKKSEQWSLGGSKAQRDFLEAEPTGFDSGPSISGLGPISCAAGVPTVVCATNMPALTENKFALLGRISENDQLPSPPRDGDNNEKTNNHISTSDLIGDAVSYHNLKKIDEDVEDLDLPSPPGCDDHNSDGVSEYSPHKKHLSTNNKKIYTSRPEVDLNSIESVSECKLKYSDLDLPDGLYGKSQSNDSYKKKNKKKKKKNKNKNSPSNDTSDEEDDKVVKCLYYTLMCCECTIS